MASVTITLLSLPSSLCFSRNFNQSPASPFFSTTPRSKRCRFHSSSARSPHPSPVTIVASSTVTNSVPARCGIYKVGDFMTKKEDLHVVKPNTTVDEALEILVEKRITGFPVIDDDWELLEGQMQSFKRFSLLTEELANLFCQNRTIQMLSIIVDVHLRRKVGVVSDYDLLALDSISGGCQNDTNLFPNVDSTWKTFNELQKLILKNNGKVVGDLMTSNPLVVYETTNLEDAVRLLLETKYRRLPVVGIITRGDIVRAALQIKSATKRST